MLTRPKPNDLFYDLNYRRSNVMRYSPGCRGLSRESDVGLYAQARLLDVIITVSRWNGPMGAHRSAFTALTSAPSRAAEQWPCLHLSPSSWQRELSACSSGGWQQRNIAALFVWIMSLWRSSKIERAVCMFWCKTFQETGRGAHTKACAEDFWLEEKENLCNCYWQKDLVTWQLTAFLSSVLDAVSSRRWKAGSSSE